MTGGTRLSERERKEWVGSARGRLGRLVSRGRPSWASGLLFYFYFFLLLSFSFILDFCLEFLKSFSYSDLNKI
jgi:hypothetical protein